MKNNNNDYHSQKEELKSEIICKSDKIHRQLKDHKLYIRICQISCPLLAISGIYLLANGMSFGGVLLFTAVGWSFMGCYSYIEHNKLSSEDHDETHQLAILFKKERRITTKRKDDKKNNILEELRKEYFTPISESAHE